MKQSTWLLTLSLLLWACGGTGVGNPGEISNAPASAYATPAILQSICTLLVACNGALSSSACLSGVAATSGIETTLGLSAGSYANYSSLEAAEEAGSIQANQTAASLCESRIAVLSCSAPAVEAAYQSGAGNPFADVPGMMPTSAGSCGSVF